MQEVVKKSLNRSALDALWMKQKVHQTNIANYETPNYKANKLSFKQVVEKAANGETKTNFKVDIDKSNDLSLRVDGNNVNMEVESLELYKTYVQYSYLTKSISNKFSGLKYVANQSLK